mgnify:FL=1
MFGQIPSYLAPVAAILIVGAFIVTGFNGCNKVENAAAAPQPPGSSTSSQVRTVQIKLQRGLNSYNGVRDTRTFNFQPDNNYGSETTSRVQSASGQIQRSLYYFDLTGVTALVGATDACALEVTEGALELTGQNSDNPSYPPFELMFFKSSAPLFDEATVTHNQASTGAPWPVGGMILAAEIQPFQFNLDLSYGTSRINFPAEILYHWLCHPESNKGFLIKYNAESSPSITTNGLYLSTSEATDIQFDAGGATVSRRPALLINIKVSE